MNAIAAAMPAFSPDFRGTLQLVLVAGTLIRGKMATLFIINDHPEFTLIYKGAKDLSLTGI